MVFWNNLYTTCLYYACSDMSCQEFSYKVSVFGKVYDKSIKYIKIQGIIMQFDAVSLRANTK